MFAAVIGAIAVLGGYEVAGRGAVAGAVALFGFTVAAAVTEELIFRGILFRIVEGRVGTGLALALDTSTDADVLQPQPGRTRIRRV